MPQSYDSIRSAKQAKTWFAVTRTIFEHDVVGVDVPPPPPADPDTPAWFPFMLWQWMLREAAYEPRSRSILGKSILLQRGQLAAAQSHLARKANWTRKGVRAFLAKLHRCGMILLSVPIEVQRGQLTLAIEGPAKGQPTTIVTICNYDKFQFGLHNKGPAKGHDGARVYTRDKRQEETPVGPVENPSSVAEQNRADASTDGAPGEGLPFTEEALAACEAMGFTRKTLVDRYAQKTARRTTPIRDPSAYLITMAIDMAAKARGVPASALRASMSKNRRERIEGIREATGEMPPISERMRIVVTRRCKRAGVMAEAMLAAWAQRCAGLRVLHPDQSVDAFCSQWLQKQKAA